MLWAGHSSLQEAIPSTAHPLSRGRNGLQGSHEAHCKVCRAGIQQSGCPCIFEVQKDGRAGAEAGRLVEAGPGPRQQWVETGQEATVWRNSSERNGRLASSLVPSRGQPGEEIGEAGWVREKVGKGGAWAELGGTCPISRGCRSSVHAGQSLHLPIFQERLEIQISHEISGSLKLPINLLPVDDNCVFCETKEDQDNCVICGNQGGPTHSSPGGPFRG